VDAEHVRSRVERADASHPTVVAVTHGEVERLEVALVAVEARLLGRDDAGELAVIPIRVELDAVHVDMAGWPGRAAARAGAAREREDREQRRRGDVPSGQSCAFKSCFPDILST
jgi:hypothetical protein